MAKKRIIAPAKIEWTLRFKNKCMDCGKNISWDKLLCAKCSIKRRRIR
jgi:hypothetical protein